MAPSPFPLHTTLSPPASLSVNMQRDLTPNRTAMMNFGFQTCMPSTHTSANLSLPPAPNFPLLGEKRSTETSPLKKAHSGGFVLHQDPAFRRDVQKFFGHMWPADKPTTKYYDQNDVPTVYKAADDDVAVWRAGSEAESGVKGSMEKDKFDRVKSAEDKNREFLLERLRHKLFNDLDDTRLDD